MLPPLMPALRARAQLRCCLASIALLGVGCDAHTLGDDLEVDIPDQSAPLEVDLSCSGCDTTVSVDVSFDPQAYLAADAEVVLEQYRAERRHRNGYPGG